MPCLHRIVWTEKVINCSPHCFNSMLNINISTTQTTVYYVCILSVYVFKFQSRVEVVLYQVFCREALFWGETAYLWNTILTEKVPLSYTCTFHIYAIIGATWGGGRFQWVQGLLNAEEWWKRDCTRCLANEKRSEVGSRPITWSTRAGLWD